MADFTYIHEHPWLTVGAIAVGGFVLYLIIHKRNSGAGTATDGTVYTGTTAGVDPTVQAQIAAQAQTIQGNLAGLSIQGQTQIALAQIGAGVQSQTVAATQDVTNKQTEAQLQLGTATLDAQVQAASINAAVQMATINAIVAAFEGNHPVTNPTPTSTYTPTVTYTTPTYTAPISTVNPPQSVTVSQPISTSPSNTGNYVYDGSMSNYFQTHPGVTWDQYWTDVQSANNIVAGSSYDPAYVARQTQIWATAYEDWKADPLSPRNNPV